MQTRTRYGGRFGALLLLVLLPGLAASAQDLPIVRPESVGLSSARLDRIASAVQKEIDAKRIAGMVTLVSRHDKVVWLKAQGARDREAGEPMRTDTLFRICSMTKPITSVAVMMLYEEGRFLLDDPVSKFLPEFKNPRVLVKPATGEPYSIPAAREITIRDLLSHTSGIAYQWNADLGPLYAAAGVADGMFPYDGTIEDSVKRLAGVPLLFSPGDRWEYGLGVDVLGRLVEVVSGKTLDAFFRERLFEPLGMKDTYFYPPDEKLRRLAAAYGYFPDKGLQRFPETPLTEGAAFTYSADYPYRGPKKLFSGGAGLTSTVADYWRFCQMILQHGTLGGRRFLSRKSVELMSQDHVGKASADEAFGLGFEVQGIKEPLHELGSRGEISWQGFFYTRFSIDPKEDLIVISMGQLHPTGDLALGKQVHALAYQALVE